MDDKHFVAQIFAWTAQDNTRLQALKCLHSIKLPHSYIAAGFIRNMVWDHLHQKTAPTPLNDIDVIYYDADNPRSDVHKIYEQRLNSVMPEVNWQVRNQASMHIKKGHNQYRDIVDAMRYWPEKETGIAMRLNDDEEGFEFISAFGTRSLFDLEVTYNPKAPLAVFEQRLEDKAWLSIWPKLKVNTASIQV